MKRCIVIKTQFEAIHCWPECPIEEVSFLKYPHRHIFHVKVKWKVIHNDRELEFILMKRKVDQFFFGWGGEDLGKMSCEDIAEDLHKEFPSAFFISIFEDNENGVEVVYD